MDNEEMIKRILTEYSLLHIQHWIEMKEMAVISAQREVLENVTSKTFMGKLQIGHKFTTRENNERTKALRASLLTCGYGITRIGGTYIESVGASKAAEVPKQSILVVNLHDTSDFYKTLFKLSEYFNQDYFLYKEIDSDSAYKVYTNAARYDEIGKSLIRYKKEQDAGRIYCRISDEFLSRINNKSSTLTTDEFLPSDTTYSINDRKLERRRHTLSTEINQEIESCMIEDTSRHHGVMGMIGVSLCAQPVMDAIREITDSEKYS